MPQPVCYKSNATHLTLTLAHEQHRLISKIIQLRNETDTAKTPQKHSTANKNMAAKPRRLAITSGHSLSTLIILFTNPLQEKNVLSNGVRYLRVGGRGFCLGPEKTRSQKNA